MLISIVMPSFNAENTIRASILSVLSQTYPNWELIICDDGSSDRTIELIKTFFDRRIMLITNTKTKGAAGARNSSIEKSNGSYICFLDSDDIWTPEKLEVQLSFMVNNNVDFSYGSYYIFKDDINSVQGVFKPPFTISRNRLLKTCDIGCSTVMIKKMALMDFEFPCTPKEDYAAWLCTLKTGLDARCYPGVHSYYRLSKNSVSSNKIKEIKSQFYVLRTYGGINIFYILFCMFFYIFEGLKKHVHVYRCVKKNKV